MNEDAIVLIRGFFDEIQDFDSYLVVVVEEELPVVVKPVEGQILDTDLGPLVLKLPSSAIDYM